MHKIAALLAGATVVTLPTIAGAHAQVSGPVACGHTITQSTALMADVGPCTNTASSWAPTASRWT